MKCDICGTEFKSGNRPYGVPNGETFICKNGEVITICADCMITLGQMTDMGKDKFFEFLKAVKGEKQA